MRVMLRARFATRLGMVLFFVLGTFASMFGFLVKDASAAGFTMQTGYYVGDGTSSKIISGVGFQPDFVIIKTSSAAEGGFKTSAMPANTASAFSATAVTTTSDIVFTSDGFTVGSTANVVNVVHRWTAFGGSDCSATGNFCVGTYTGNNAASRTIAVGFQPDLVINKRATNIAAHYRTSTQPANYSSYFVTTADNTAGALISGFTSTGFTIGSADNANGVAYYYIAFKATAGSMAVGTYTGDGLDNRSITGVGFKPDLVMMKNITSATANNRRAIMANNQHTTDGTSYIANAVIDTANAIQRFESDGFQLGTSVAANESAQSFGWFAFRGVPTPTASGTFQMATGSYTGTGAIQSVTGLGFSPDLVIIKANAASYKVFRTKMVKGDSTLYLAVATAAFAGGITSLDANGFSLGTSTIVNGSGVTFHWQAFGNAYNPETKTGAADFAIGSYTSNNVDGTLVGNLPFQPDFIFTRGGSNIGGYKISSQPATTAGFFSGAGEVTNAITAINTDGFRLGTNSSANVSGSIRYDWFAFKVGSNFKTGSYAGDQTASRNVDLGGIQPELIWVKRATGSDAVSRPSTMAANETQAFVNAVNTTGIISGVTSTGMTITSNFQVNSSGETYRYMAWDMPVVNGVLTGDIVDSTGASVTSPSIAMGAISFPISCTTSTGVFGTTSQKLRVSNTTSSPSWSVSVAPTQGATALWRNGGNTRQYDMNDYQSNGSCGDGADGDTVGGYLRVRPSGATLTPSAGCNSTGLTLGSDAWFNEGTVDAITLLSASSGASTNCYWDMTGTSLEQVVPDAQPADTYTLELTITTTAL